MKGSHFFTHLLHHRLAGLLLELLLVRLFLPLSCGLRPSTTLSFVLLMGGTLHDPGEGAKGGKTADVGVSEELDRDGELR